MLNMRLRTYIFLLILSVAGPIIVNIIVRNSIPINLPSWMKVYGLPSEWLSFFSNYSGGIIGGITAYIVARMQILDNKKEQEANHRKDEINILEIISLDLLDIISALDEYRKILDKNVNVGRSIGQFPQLNKNIWLKVGILNDVSLQTELFQAQHFYNDFIDSLNKDITQLEETLMQLKKTTTLIKRKINSDFDFNLTLTDLLLRKNTLEEELRFHRAKRKAARSLIEKDYISSLKQLHARTETYIQELKSL